MKFANLHCHTTYSIYDGFGYPKEFIKASEKKENKGIAITEHGNMNSFANFYNQKTDIKKIYGVEAYFIDDIKEWEEKKKKGNIDKTRFHVLMLAKNNNGLSTLFKLITESHQDSYYYYKPRMDIALLEKYNDDIIISTACIGGIIGDLVFKFLHKINNKFFNNSFDVKNKTYEMLNKFKEKEEYDSFIELFLFKKIEERLQKFLNIMGNNDFYGELQWHDMEIQHFVNALTIYFSNKFNFKLITTNDCHYPLKSNIKARSVYRDMSYGKSKMTVIKDEKELGLYVKSANDMMTNFYNLFSICYI